MQVHCKNWKVSGKCRESTLQKVFVQKLFFGDFKYIMNFNVMQFFLCIEGSLIKKKYIQIQT